MKSTERHATALFLALFLILVSVRTEAQPLPVAGGVLMANLPASERDQLGDPFFELVLKDHSDITSLRSIENLIQPNANLRQVFVVSEDVIDQTRGRARRSVLAFRGSNGRHALDNNVMLSVFFNSEQFSDRPGSIEALGWDSDRDRYNYYLLSGGAWRFGGDSRRAATLTATQRRGTCLSCHVNGAPIMKELLIPWNNWRSFTTSSETSYLSRISESAWPVAADLRLDGNLTGAEILEGLVIGGINRFVDGQVNLKIKRDSQGQPQRDTNGMESVTDGRQLLRHLFLTTEVNLISSNSKSGLHPFPNGLGFGPQSPISIPNSFFLNANLIGGQSIPGFEMRGLGVTQSRSFESFASFQPQEYKQLMQGVKLGNQPGDTFFAWFTPEPSHIDNFMVDELLRRGIVTPQFVAAALAVDLENPIMSEARSSLLKSVPTEFQYQPLPQGTNFLRSSRHPDSLTTQIIQELENQDLSAQAAKAEFLQNLKSPDPLAVLRNKVEAYSQRVRTALENGTTRETELKRLFEVLIERRNKMLTDEVFHVLDESGLLMPMP